MAKWITSVSRWQIMRSLRNILVRFLLYWPTFCISFQVGKKLLSRCREFNSCVASSYHNRRCKTDKTCGEQTAPFIFVTKLNVFLIPCHNFISSLKGRPLYICTQMLAWSIFWSDLRQCFAIKCSAVMILVSFVWTCDSAFDFEPGLCFSVLSVVACIGLIVIGNVIRFQRHPVHGGPDSRNLHSWSQLQGCR